MSIYFTETFRTSPIMVCVPRLELAATTGNPQSVQTRFGEPRTTPLRHRRRGCFRTQLHVFSLQKSRSGMNARFIPLLLV